MRLNKVCRGLLTGALSLALLLGFSALVRACSSPAEAAQPQEHPEHAHRAPVLHQHHYGNVRNWYGTIDGKRAVIYERREGPRVRTWGKVGERKFDYETIDRGEQ